MQEDPSGTFHVQYMKFICVSLVTGALFYYVFEESVRIKGKSFVHLIIVLIFEIEAFFTFISWLCILVYAKDMYAFLTALGRKFTRPNLTSRIVVTPYPDLRGYDDITDGVCDGRKYSPGH